MSGSLRSVARLARMGARHAAMELNIQSRAFPMVTVESRASPLLAPRSFATGSRTWWSKQDGGAPAGETKAAGGSAEATTQTEETQEGAAAEATPEELNKQLNEALSALEETKKTAADSKEKLLRTLADMENLRDRMQRQMTESKQFAVQAVVKSFLEVVDNLERAIESVPASDLQSSASEIDVEKALQLLKRLHDGVVLTENIMLKLLEKEGVTRYDPMGQPFDPNLHNAMFNVPKSGDHKTGHVAVVVKKGYLLHDRPVRAADVGVAQ